MTQMVKRKHFYALALFCILQSAFIAEAFSQVQTARTITINNNCRGFYEYLPQGYSAGTQEYPLMIFMHGAGEVGNGSSDLPAVLRNGPPSLISRGLFPTSFTVNGNTFRFIIISPQFINGWPTVQDLDDVLTYATTHYRVDKKRVYLTGLSMGAGVIMYYTTYNKSLSDKIAAIVPVCSGAQVGPSGAQVLASSNIAVWATHNQGDLTASVNFTINNVDLINNSNPPPATRAKISIFPDASHDAWTRTYDPNFAANNPTYATDGLNVYQWMLQFQQGVANAALPVVMGDYKATLLSDNATVAVNWTTLSEANNRYFSIEKSKDGSNFSLIDTVASFKDANGHSYSFTDTNPFKGNNFYRLSQTDLDGKITYFKVLKVIVPEKNQNTFRINPNPVINSFQLEWVNTEKGQVNIILSDMQGHVLKTWRSEKSNTVWQQTFDVTQIPPGTYTIQLKSNNNSEVQRFIKR